MKKIISLLAAFLLCALLVLPVCAEGESTTTRAIPAERQLPLLVDEAGLLTETQAASLLKKLENYTEDVQCDIAIATVPTLNGVTAREYADDFYDYNGYGYGDDDDGILFLLASAERKWWITTYGVGKKFTETELQSAVSDNAEALTRDDFNTALNGIADDLHQMVYAERHPKVDAKWIFIDLAIGFVLALIIMKLRTANLKSVRQQVNADAYVVPGSLALSQSYDHFLFRNVTRTAKPVDDNSGNGSHTSSSGRSHGGTGGSF